MIKRKVQFLKPFSHPELGNVWEGRIAVLDYRLAAKMVQAGKAKLITGSAKNASRDT